MLRRTVLRAAYDQFKGHISGDPGYMTLQQACTIFGFQMNEPWTRKEVKQRFRGLALKFHPDNGGTDEQFRLLKEAQHLLLTHRHDKGSESGETTTKGATSKVRFHHVTYDDMTNTIHRQTSDRPELRSFSLRDFALFIFFVSFIFAYYIYHAAARQRAILRGRWTYTADQLQKEHEGSTADTVVHDKNWHPWRADSETSDRMDDVAVFQGQLRRDVVEERRRLVPQTYMPWQPGGPFAVHGGVPISGNAAASHSVQAEAK